MSREQTVKTHLTNLRRKLKEVGCKIDPIETVYGIGYLLQTLTLNHLYSIASDIETEHLQKIFDRFWRADTLRAQWEDGSGLGLAIVKNIITRHQGRIEVTSKKNVSSCFVVQLPISEQSRSQSRSTI